MNFINTLDELNASFTAKEHSKALGNTEECKMYSHIHPSAEVLMVISGNMTVHILGRPSEKLTAGQAALLFPFQSHSYDRTEGTEFFRFNFASSLLQSFFSANHNNVGDRVSFPIDLTEYEPFFNAVRKKSVNLYKAKGFLYNVIGDYTKSVPLTKMHVDDNILAKVIAYVDDHKSEHITLSKVAAALGYNEKYLSRAINDAAGFGFSTLLSTLRLEAAKYLLLNSKRTIMAIAIDCGFGSERNFYRIFKELTGNTPNKYRASGPKKPAENDAIL
jgi:AraC-like DNA-binding protein